MRVWLIKTFAAGVVTALVAITSYHPTVVAAKAVAAYTSHLQDVFAAVHRGVHR